MQPGAFAFALLFAVESVSRATIVSVVPIQAYDLLQDEQKRLDLLLHCRQPRHVRDVCAPIALPAAAAPLRLYARRAVPRRRRWRSSPRTRSPGQAGGLFLRILGASTLSITLNLYIMEYIPKHGLVQSESLRLALGTFAWTFGPSLGVWLYVQLRRRRAVSVERHVGAHPDRALLVPAPLGKHGDPAGKDAGPSIRSPASGASSRSRACGLRGSSRSAAPATGRRSTSTPRS